MVKRWKKSNEGTKGPLWDAEVSPERRERKERHHSPVPSLHCEWTECSHAWQMSCPLSPISLLSASWPYWNSKRRVLRAWECAPMRERVSQSVLHWVCVEPCVSVRGGLGVCVWIGAPKSEVPKLAKLLNTAPTVLSLKCTSTHENVQRRTFTDLMRTHKSKGFIAGSDEDIYVLPKAITHFTTTTVTWISSNI